MHLRDILAGLYPDTESSRRIASEAGLQTALISFRSVAANNWFNILEHAEKSTRIEALLDVVLSEYPDIEALQVARQHGNLTARTGKDDPSSAEVRAEAKAIGEQPARAPYKGLPRRDEDEEDGGPGDDSRVDPRLRDERGSGFLARVERVAVVREAAGAVITRHRAPPPFAGVLEVTVRDGALVDVRVVGALEPVSYTHLTLPTILRV